MTISRRSRVTFSIIGPPRLQKYRELNFLEKSLIKIFFSLLQLFAPNIYVCMTLSLRTYQSK